jgi:hypothetical protein
MRVDGAVLKVQCVNGDVVVRDDGFWQPVYVNAGAMTLVVRW